MRLDRHDREDGVHLALCVPARPEALPVVRVVLMSYGAVNGVQIDEILARSRDVASAFARVLAKHPETRHIEMRYDARESVPRRVRTAFT